MEKVATALPLDWHPDGTPIFLRGDFIRDPRPIEPANAEIYDNIILPEHKHLRPEIRFNLIRIPSWEKTHKAPTAWLGKSQKDPRHGKPFGRIIQGLDSCCRVILQRWKEPGKVTDFLMLTLQPLQMAIIPPTYEATLANASVNGPARFFELHAKEEQRDLTTSKLLDGPGYILKPDGLLIPNDQYTELPIPRIQPGVDTFKFLQRRPLYEMLTSYPLGFDFIDPPKDIFFSGGI